VNNWIFFRFIQGADAAMLSGTLAAISSADQVGFLNEIRKALLVSAFLSLMGMIPSAVGGSEKSPK